jgi:hypothetical protein
MVDVLNKHAASTFSVEIFCSKNGGAEQSNIDPNCCENLNFIQRTQIICKCDKNIGIMSNDDTTI